MEEGRNTCPFILFLFHLLRSDRWQKKKIKNVPYVMTNKITKDEAFIFAADFPMDLLNFRLVVIRISNKPSKA